MWKNLELDVFYVLFGSPWDDMVVNKGYPENLHPFLSRIEKIVDERKIPNKRRIYF